MSKPCRKVRVHVHGTIGRDMQYVRLLAEQRTPPGTRFVAVRYLDTAREWQVCYEKEASQP